MTDLCFCVRMRISITLRSACLHKSFPAEKGELKVGRTKTKRTGTGTEDKKDR